jgi:hypothetical protein
MDRKRFSTAFRYLLLLHDTKCSLLHSRAQGLMSIAGMLCMAYRCLAKHGYGLQGSRWWQVRPWTENVSVLLIRYLCYFFT